eukprot:COSAG05_NODE_1308_length_5225_cov_3.554233_2_plen_106_part_00
MYSGVHARIRYACKTQSCMATTLRSNRFRAHRTIAPDRRRSRVIDAGQRARPRANTITHMSPERRRLQAIRPPQLLLPSIILAAGALDPVHRRAAIFARCLSRMP